jgi:glycosyltransferase involved in cell wall biosynthesis
MLDFGSYNNKNMIKKAAIYDPYLDTLGGGERYCLTVAEFLLKNNYSVDLFWSGDSNLIAKAQQRFNLNLSQVNLVPDIFNIIPQRIDCVEDTASLIKISERHQPHSSPYEKILSLLKKIQITRNYDLFFYISDWSVPFLFSKNNLLHVQLPLVLKNSFKETLLNKIKIHFYHRIICNSRFTQNFAKSFFGDKCQIVYPPVDIEKFNPDGKKENIILSVGRFDNLLNSKKQDVMIKAFQKLSPSYPGWKLILAGGSLDSPDKNSYLHHLKKLASGFPVEFVINPDFQKLSEIYASSKIYWHAAGFDVDENLHPESTEHFGIAPVEAMASGLVPLVVAKGGLPEIVDEGKNGYLWQNIDDLITKTNLLINSPKLLKEISAAAIVKSQEFSKLKFEENFTSLLHL